MLRLRVLLSRRFRRWLLLLLLWLLLRLRGLLLVLLWVMPLLAPLPFLLLVLLLLLVWLLLLLLLLCWRGLWLLRIIRRLVGIAAGAEGPVLMALVHLWRRGIGHRLIFGSLLPRFCLGRTPRRCPLRRRRRARAQWARGRTVAADWRWR